MVVVEVELVPPVLHCPGQSSAEFILSDNITPGLSHKFFRVCKDEMKITRFLSVLVICLAAVFPFKVVFAEQVNTSALDAFFADVVADYRYHYSTEKLLQLGVAVGVSGIMANTNIDSSFHENFQLDIRSDRSNTLSADFTMIGDASQMIVSVPLYLGVMLLGNSASETSAGPWLGTWATRSLRSLLIGAPQQYVLTNLLGSGRPTEGDSSWDLFNGDGDNAVSGHAFYGAVPFLTAAGLTENTFAKYSLYALSVFPGLARLNDEKHYLSQVFLGWSLAYMAVDSVEKGGAKREKNIMLYPVHKGLMLTFSMEF